MLVVGHYKPNHESDRQIWAFTLTLTHRRRCHCDRAQDDAHKGERQKNSFSYSNFFHMESIANEHVGLEVISMDEFLQREGMTGNLRDKHGKVVFPPGNKTDWNNQHGTEQILERYLHKVGTLPGWDPNQCMVAFPKDPSNFEELKSMLKSIQDTPPKWESYIGHPTPVDASPEERLRENWAWRKELCMYTEELQNAKLIHFATEAEENRLLVHFYAFLFFESWKEDLWMKRFVRDHVRYVFGWLQLTIDRCCVIDFFCILVELICHTPIIQIH
jgi:hypothetical protein